MGLIAKEGFSTVFDPETVYNILKVSESLKRGSCKKGVFITSKYSATWKRGWAKSQRKNAYFILPLSVPRRMGYMPHAALTERP